MAGADVSLLNLSTMYARHGSSQLGLQHQIKALEMRCFCTVLPHPIIRLSDQQQSSEQDTRSTWAL